MRERPGIRRSVALAAGVLVTLAALILGHRLRLRLQYQRQRYAKFHLAEGYLSL